MRGGRLNAIGTATAPIVFTSDQPIGQRGRGDWGGLIINGRAPDQLRQRRGRGRRRHRRLRRHRRQRQQRHPSLRARGVLRHRVQPGQRAERHRVPGRRPRHAGRSRSGAHEPRRRDGVVRRHRGRQVPRDVQRRGRQRRLDVRLDRARCSSWPSRSAETTPTTASRRTTTSSTTTRCRARIRRSTTSRMCGDPDRNEGGESPRAANLRRGTAFTIRNFLITGFKTVGSADRDDEHGHDRAGRQRHVADGRRRGLEHRRDRRRRGTRCTPASRPTSTAAVSRTSAPTSIRACPPTALLESRGAELPAERHRHAGWRPAGADSAAERRLLRRRHVHRRRAAGSGSELDGRLDVVPAELSLLSTDQRLSKPFDLGSGWPIRFV